MRARMKVRILFSIMLCMAVVPRVLADRIPDVIQAAKRSVVGVGTYQITRSPVAELMGTGFVVADGRHIITNHHVVSNQLDQSHHEQLVVFVGQGREAGRRIAKKIASDEEHDLALLQIEGDPLPAFSLGNSDRVREGELYLFTGFPIGAVLGLYPATHRGSISAITPIAIPASRVGGLDPKRIKRLQNPYDIFQLDATAYPGNSGSPLYDPESAQVIGVINMVFVKGSKENTLKSPSGISYAIPARYVEALLSRHGIKK